jgi:acyl-coenzyme A synthetase/AMP-(fatty) acid ligase
VCADVELAEGSDEDTVRLAIARLSASSLQPYQVPRLVRFVDAISTNASGKKTRIA